MYDTLRANTEMYKRMLRQSLHCPFKIQYATLKQHEMNQLPQWTNNWYTQLCSTAAAYFLTDCFFKRDILSWDGSELSCGKWLLS